MKNNLPQQGQCLLSVSIHNVTSINSNFCLKQTQKRQHHVRERNEVYKGAALNTGFAYACPGFKFLTG